MNTNNDKDDDDSKFGGRRVKTEADDMDGDVRDSHNINNNSYINKFINKSRENASK